MNYRNFVIVLFFSLLHFQISAQTYTQTVRGFVIDADSKSPLPGANIVLLNSDPLNGALSDSDGEFSLKNVPVGRQELQVSMIGYAPAKLSNLDVRSGKELILTVELEEEVVQTEAVIIKAYSEKDKPINEMATVSARSFSVEETERYAGTWFDPARMAANYAGVNAAGDQRNDIIIRGNSPTGLLWRLEGIDIPNPNHFGTLGTTGGPISILNNSLLDNSDFYTGAFPAEYGNALSGVFDLNMRSGNNQTREYTAQIGMNGFELAAEGPFSKKSKASYLASYRYSTLSIFDYLGLNFGVSGVPEYHDGSFKINVPGTKLGKFSLFGVGGQSHIQVLSKNQDEDDWTFGASGLDLEFGSAMGVIGLTHNVFFDKNTSLSTAFAISGTQSSARTDSAFFKVKPTVVYGDKSTEIKYSANTKFIKKINTKNTLNAGFQADMFQINYADSFLMPDYSYRKLTESSDETLLLLQTYAQFKHKFSEHLAFYGGIHAQYLAYNSSKIAEPRLSLKWNFLPKHTLSFAAGSHSQLQPRLFYFFQTRQPDGTYTQTNRNLDFSKSNQLVLSYDYVISKNLRLKTETYYQHLYDYPVEIRPSEYSLINYGTTFYSGRADSLQNTGTGTNYGAELTFEKFLSQNYYFLLTTSVFESTYTGSDNIERNTIFNGNYVVNLLGGYAFDIGTYNTLKLDAKIVNAGGKRYIPIDSEASKLAGKAVYDYSKAYESQYASYFRIDARMSYKWNLKKFTTEIAFDVQNITKHQNVLTETYNPKTNSVDYDYQLGLFYVFLLRFQF